MKRSPRTKLPKAHCGIRRPIWRPTSRPGTEQLRQLSVRLMNTQDEERRRIARELHDSAGQYLAGIQMNLSAILNRTPGLEATERSRVSDSLELGRTVHL